MKILTIATTLTLIALPGLANEDVAVQTMLSDVATVMEAAGYETDAGAIRDGRLGQYVVEYAYDICEDRSIGETDQTIFATRAQAFDSSTKEGEQDI